MKRRGTQNWLSAWRSASLGRCLAALAFCRVLSAQAGDIPAFSLMQEGGPVVGWNGLRPAPRAAETRYALVRDGEHVVLQADADHAMSGLVVPVTVDLAKTPILRWRWKISAPVASADMSKKSGDDYAARIYVMFDYPRAKLSLATRAKLRLAEAIYGQAIPTAALNYVWDNTHPIGTIAPNSYTDRARMVVVESGAERAGQWQTESRDVAADFRAAFGEEPPPVLAVALATDTDNTGEHVISWYGDLRFVAR